MTIYHTENQTTPPNLLNIFTGCSRKSKWMGQAFTNFVTEDYSFSYNYLRTVCRVNWVLSNCSGSGKKSWLEWRDTSYISFTLVLSFICSTVPTVT